LSGDKASTDEIVAQIETDKVTIDVQYMHSTPGKITEILVAEQDTVKVDQPLFKVALCGLISLSILVAG